MNKKKFRPIALLVVVNLQESTASVLGRNASRTGPYQKSSIHE